MELAMMIDRAMEQTYRAGHRYALVPIPWFNDWLTYIGVHGTEFSGDGVCIGRMELSQLPDDGDGNVLICLMPVDHSEPCGYTHLLSDVPLLG